MQVFNELYTHLILHKSLHVSYQQRTSSCADPHNIKLPVPAHLFLPPLQVRVEGAGAQERSQLRYRLSDNENFGVDEAGVIYNLRRLDHEGSGGRYTLQVSAEQRGEGQRKSKERVRKKGETRLYTSTGHGQAARRGGGRRD